MELMRLQKFLAQSNVCSRRTAEELIARGKVIVNNKKAEIGDKIDPEKDRVFIDGKAIRYKPMPFSYFIINKPRGYVTTMKDESGRKCIADLTGGITARVYPVGRLDKESEGLIILTNDGELANTLTHPSKHISKVYRVTVMGIPKLETLKELRNGVTLDDGYHTEPAEVKVHNEKEDRTILHFTIREGKNRQIRRMCEAVGLDVVLLKRIAVGKLKLGHLKNGEYRLLNDEEINYLKSL